MTGQGPRSVRSTRRGSLVLSSQRCGATRNAGQGEALHPSISLYAPQSAARLGLSYFLGAELAADAVRNVSGLVPDLGEALRLGPNQETFLDRKVKTLNSAHKERNKAEFWVCDLNGQED